MLLLAHPEVADRDCGDCTKWLYDEETGQRKQWPPRSGRLVPRPAGSRPPCSECPKCRHEKEPSPEAGRRNTLSSRNHKTLARYHEQQAAGGEVLDPITRRNFGILHEVFAAYDRSRQRLLSTILMARP